MALSFSNVERAYEVFNELQKTVLPGNSLHFSCEECEGEYLDTRVELNDIWLCYITWADVQNFLNDFENLLTKYRI